MGRRRRIDQGAKWASLEAPHALAAASASALRNRSRYVGKAALVDAVPRRRLDAVQFVRRPFAFGRSAVGIRLRWLCLGDDSRQRASA
jgi:hypothetical protein